MTQRGGSPFGPELQSLLACERQIPCESEEIHERALLRARAAVANTASSKLPKRGARWLMAAALVLVAANLFGAALRTRRLAARSTLSSAPASTTMHVTRRAMSVESEQIAPAADAGAPMTEGAAIQPPPEAPKPAAQSSRGAAPASRPVTPQEAYERELEVLGPARAAVARRDFSSALTAIGEHERRFPMGLLSEEREALRVQALSGLNRPEAAARAAAAFRRRFQGSILLSHMKDLARGAP